MLVLVLVFPLTSLLIGAERVQSVCKLKDNYRSKISNKKCRRHDILCNRMSSELPWRACLFHDLLSVRWEVGPSLFFIKNCYKHKN